MSKGISLHIGVGNACFKPLPNAVAYATVLYDIAKSQGFDATLLTDDDANRDAVLEHMNKAASQINEGDILFLSFTGHGGQHAHSATDPAMINRWWVHDSSVIDIEIQDILAQCPKGSRVLAVEDCCQSGTSIEGEVLKNGSVEMYNYCEDKPFTITVPTTPRPFQAAVRSISACRDDQESGSFIAYNLNEVWDQGKYQGGLRNYYEATKASLPERILKDQTPVYLRLGDLSDNFDKQRPYTINS